MQYVARRRDALGQLRKDLLVTDTAPASLVDEGSYAVDAATW